MKKLFTIILYALLMLIILTSCEDKAVGQDGEKADEPKPSLAISDEAARECGHYSNLQLNGMLYTESFRDSIGNEEYRLRFVDFDTMKSAVICSRPNCKHNSQEECSAFGMTTEGEPVIFGKNIYFFDHETWWGKNGELMSELHIMKADIDGSARRKVATIEGEAYIRSEFIKGDVLYFIGQTQPYDPETKNYIDRRANSLYSFDLATETCTDYGVLLENYSSHVDIVGEYNGKLYLNGSYCDEPYVVDKDINDIKVYRYYASFDLKTAEIGEWDMPLSTRNEEYDKLEPMFISGGLYGYMDGANAHIIDADGNELVLEDYSLSASSVDIPINGYYINISGDYYEKSAYTAVNLKTGEILKINKKAVPHWNYVITYRDGYIVHGLLGGNEFKKVSEEELFSKAS